jgi:hypothetical protein
MNAPGRRMDPPKSGMEALQVLTCSCHYLTYQATSQELQPIADRRKRSTRRRKYGFLFSVTGQQRRGTRTRTVGTTFLIEISPDAD